MIFFPPKSRLAPVLPRQAEPFLDAFLASGQAEDWPAELLAAICWRESFFGLYLSPVGPGGTGDGGHGRGLMQIDDRSHAAWLAQSDAQGTPLWMLPEENIAQGASVLSDCRRAMPDLDVTAWVAAYNAGPLRVRTAVLAGLPVDSVTTGRDYAEDVLIKAATSHALAKNGVQCDCCLCGLKG